jgi:hypothetical protein
VRRAIADFPRMLQRIDDWIAQGVLGGEPPNVADLQIAPSLRLAMSLDDLRPAIEARQRRARCRPVVRPAAAGPDAGRAIGELRDGGRLRCRDLRSGRRVPGGQCESMPGPPLWRSSAYQSSRSQRSEMVRRRFELDARLRSVCCGDRAVVAADLEP